MDAPLLTDADLTPEQRAWSPTALEDGYACWPAGWKVEVYDGGIHFTNGEANWDWRSVALAARTYPGWRVVLRHAAGVSVYPSQGRV